jgi:putative hydrolase
VDPVEVLNRIAYLLERVREPTYRVRAFRNAAATIEALDATELRDRAASGRLRELPGIGDVTERIVLEALAGERPEYLKRLEDEAEGPLTTQGDTIRAALRGDCHTHSTWSDGGSPIRTMAEAARDLGHDYMVLTDHSHRLKIANGLSPERLRAQLEEVAEVNADLAPFRILTGMEVDILEDGTLDMDPASLGMLDLVVASVHSKLRMDGPDMTRRMVTAMANPHADILGHCTGRIVVGRGRPQSSFDAEMVFAACERFGKAVEINSRPERLDPPEDLLALAVGMGCLISIDTDAHAPGQLEWLPYGCRKAAIAEVPVERIVNSWPVEDLLAWTAGHTGPVPVP